MGAAQSAWRGVVLEKLGEGGSVRSHAWCVAPPSLLTHAGHFTSCCEQIVGGPKEISVLLVGNSTLQIHTNVAISLFFVVHQLPAET